jgi:hypothetical protein
MKASLSLLAVLTQLVSSAPTPDSKFSAAKGSSPIPFPPLDYKPSHRSVSTSLKIFTQTLTFCFVVGFRTLHLTAVFSHGIICYLIQLQRLTLVTPQPAALDL